MISDALSAHMRTVLSLAELEAAARKVSVVIDPTITTLDFCVQIGLDPQAMFDLNDFTRLMHEIMS